MSLLALIAAAFATCPTPQDTLTCATTISGQLDPGPWNGAQPAFLSCPVAGFNDLESELGGVSCGGGCLAWDCQAPDYVCGAPIPNVPQEGPEHVWAFTCATAGEVALSLTGTNCDLDLYVLDASCAETSCEAGSTNGHPAAEAITFDCVPGATFHVVVEGYGFTAKAYTDYGFGGAGYCQSHTGAPLGSYTLEFTPEDPAVTGCVVGPDPCDLDGDGVLATGSCGGADCDDTNAATGPDAEESPNGVDDDCDGVVDEGTDRYDDDGDGFSELGGDCDDTDPTRRPGAVETCDGDDDDCDGVTDEGTSCADDDGDGFCEVAPCVTGQPGDCHDGDPAQNPGETEIDGNGIDDDCDGTIDSSSPDPDGDGFTEAGGDCEPEDAAIHPGATEIDNDLDDDCDGRIDEGLPSTDDDGDGATELGGDCHDGDPAIGPAAPEIENGIDDDCDGTIDEGTASGDDDGDGFTEAGGDCDDGDDDIAPGQPEVLNGEDDDCDGLVDEGLTDLDGDGFAEDDCDDGDGFANPGMDELCDRVDNDCDGEIDEGCGEDTDAPTPVEDDGCGCASSGSPVWVGLIAGVLLLRPLHGLRGPRWWALARNRLTIRHSKQRGASALSAAPSDAP